MAENKCTVFIEFDSKFVDIVQRLIDAQNDLLGHYEIDMECGIAGRDDFYQAENDKIEKLTSELKNCKTIMKNK